MPFCSPGKKIRYVLRHASQGLGKLREKGPVRVCDKDRGRESYKVHQNIFKKIPINLISGRMPPDAFGCVPPKYRSRAHVNEAKLAEVQLG